MTDPVACAKAFAKASDEIVVEYLSLLQDRENTVLVKIGL